MAKSTQMSHTNMVEPSKIQSSSDYVQVIQQSHVLLLTLVRAEKKNALNLAMYAALTGLIKQAVSESSVRAIVLTGSEGCFSSGNDLADFANATEIQSADNPILSFMHTFSECPKPIVAAVDGVAVGIGTTLLMHCDFVFASPRARFKLPFVNLGLTPEYASSLILPRLVGHVKASEWLLLGEEFNAEEAKKAGLLNAVIEDPLARALEVAEKLSNQPPAAVRKAKALIKTAKRQEVDACISKEFQEFAKALQGPEFAEAVGAFFEKRQPDFSKFE